MIGTSDRAFDFYFDTSDFCVHFNEMESSDNSAQEPAKKGGRRLWLMIEATVEQVSRPCGRH